MNAIILLSILGIATLFVGVFNQRKLILPLVITGVIGAFLVNFLEWNGNTPDYYKTFTDMVVFDNYSIAFSGALLFISVFVFLLCHHYHGKEESHVADIYALMIFTMIGGSIMTAYNNLTMLFVGIEILSISLYILAGSKKMDLASNEASIKYFLMGSFSTGFLLFGIALIYGVTHSFNLDVIRTYIDSHIELPILFHVGILMMLVGLSFKVSAVPFHFWTPDVYQGSPSIITSFMATVVKTAGFAALFKLLHTWFGTLTLPHMLFETIWGITALTITLGNMSALVQKGVKRMLAYSSIANAGYLLIAILALNAQSASAILYYSVIYSIGTILAFGVLMLVMETQGGDDYHSFAGIGRKNPLLGGVMVIAMLSLAGIPPLAGFFAKYFLFVNSMNSGYKWIVLVAVVNSCVGIYYYFRVMVAMFAKEDAPEITIPLSYRIALILGSLVLLVLGLFPEILSGILQ